MHFKVILELQGRAKYGNFAVSMIKIRKFRRPGAGAGPTLPISTDVPGHTGSPQNFWQNRSLKTAQNHKFRFWERHKSNSFGPRDAIPIPYENVVFVV